MVQAVDILILSNGPGEVTTWVRPVVQQLGEVLGSDRQLFRISVILSPCPHATGGEAAIARSYPQIDRVQEAPHFWQFLLWGKTAQNWDWHEKGVVIFLGGDQIYPVIIGKKLGYRTVVYAEWDARWHQWIDRFGVMKPEIVAAAPKKYSHKFTVVGDLMADVSTIDEFNKNSSTQHSLIGLLPGSKPAKLTQGVPLTLAIAECIHAALPHTRFVIPVAPTLDVNILASFADPQHNPLIEKFGGIGAKLISKTSSSLRLSSSLPDEKHLFLQTTNGLQIELWTRSPAHDLLSQCRLCLTTVGANTAELASLAVPMIVLLPTQQLDAMRVWDGLPGLLANLPLIGSIFAKTINWLIMQKGRLYAWPNIWAGKQIVPELVGQLQPEEVSKMVIDLLEHPEKLEEMRDRLRAIRGQPGAAQKLAQLVREELYPLSKQP